MRKLNPLASVALMLHDCRTSSSVLHARHSNYNCCCEESPSSRNGPESCLTVRQAKSVSRRCYDIYYCRLGALDSKYCAEECPLLEALENQLLSVR